MFLSPQVAWPAVSPGLYVFAASWRGSSYFICIPGRHRYCVYCPGTFRWVSNPPLSYGTLSILLPFTNPWGPPSVYQSMGSSGYLSGKLILCGCTALVQGLTLNVKGSYLQKLLVEASQSDLCLDWSGTSPSLLFKARSESSHRTGTRPHLK